MISMQNAQPPAIGLDFGTTNSSMALATGDSRVQLASFPTRTVDTLSFRSVLYWNR